MSKAARAALAACRWPAGPRPRRRALRGPLRRPGCSARRPTRRVGSGAPVPRRAPTQPPPRARSCVAVSATGTDEPIPAAGAHRRARSGRAAQGDGRRGPGAQEREGVPRAGRGDDLAARGGRTRRTAEPSTPETATIGGPAGAAGTLAAGRAAGGRCPSRGRASGAAPRRPRRRRAAGAAAGRAATGDDGGGAGRGRRRAVAAARGRTAAPASAGAPGPRRAGQSQPARRGRRPRRG